MNIELHFPPNFEKLVSSRSSLPSASLRARSFLMCHMHSCSISFSQCLFSYISSPRRIPRERWIGPGSFPPMVFLVFWGSFLKRCKGVHCVDLSESFPTSIYLQKSASIQPRTSPSKFGGKYSILFTGVLSSSSRSSCVCLRCCSSSCEHLWSSCALLRRCWSRHSTFRSSSCERLRSSSRSSCERLP